MLCIVVIGYSVLCFAPLNISNEMLTKKCGEGTQQERQRDREREKKEINKTQIKQSKMKC